MEQTLGSSSEDFLEQPVRGGHSLTTDERRSVDWSGTIAGWGSDLDKSKRPGVPRDKAPLIGVERLYPPLEQQPAHIKILKSTEHARMTPVFGTACPPAGVSGLVRSFAYKFSEGRMARWLALMAADRINVVEDVVSDLARLRSPNLVSETGLASELKYNRPALLKKAAVAGLCVLVMMAYSRRSRAGHGKNTQ